MSRSQGRPKSAPIGKPAENSVFGKGLPQNRDAERFVLGSILQDDRRFSEAALLVPEDFSVDRDRQTFRAMVLLNSRGGHIDFVTVIEELARVGQLGQDGYSYIASLTDGIPLLPHIDSYVRIVREKSTLRQMIEAAGKLLNESALETTSAAEILESHMALVSDLARRADCNVTVRSIDDLGSVFSDDEPVKYVIDPELPAGALVTLAGDSESGKTTVAFAWARDAHANGHAILVLDRDANPRERIRDRLRRLGVASDGQRFRIWDYQQADEAPQPDSPMVVDWVKRQIASTGLAPVVVVDSLIAFLGPDGNENDNVQMRRVFDRCRVLTKLGAVVVLLHHTGKSETSRDGRGASDYRPAGDQGFTLTNHNPDGSRLLHTLTLKPTKSRWALTQDIVYLYDGGAMRRAQDLNALSKTVCQRLTALLGMHPGETKDGFAKIAVKAGLKQKAAREFLEYGLYSGEIRVEPNQHGRGGRYYLAADTPETSSEAKKL